MEISDADSKTRAVYRRRLAEMTPSERSNLVAALWEAGDESQKAGMRLRFPDADESEILFRIAGTRFGLELARKAYQRE